MKKFNNNGKRPYRPRYDRPSVPPRLVEKDPAKVDQKAVLASFDKMTVKLRPGEDVEQLIRRFKRMVENSGLLGELKKREAYKAPAAKKREKKAKATKRFLKNKAKMDARDRDNRE